MLLRIDGKILPQNLICCHIKIFQLSKALQEARLGTRSFVQGDTIHNPGMKNTFFEKSSKQKTQENTKSGHKSSLTAHFTHLNVNLFRVQF